MQGTVTLVVNGPTYFSSGDEGVFFGWLNRISCVERVRGKADALHVLLKPAPVSEADLRELISLFHRYRLNTSALAQLLTTENASWFRDDHTAYWHDGVFGGG